MEEHYAAACAFAIPLLDASGELGDQERARLAELAVERLERAAACAERSFVGRHREWIEKDPDLTALRRESRYALCASQYFPS